MAISPYLKRIRGHVGHDLVLLPAVAVLPWDRDGRLLMVQESQTGLWQTVGGAVDPDEAPADAAVRETQEEAGVRVRVDRIRAVTGGPRIPPDLPQRRPRQLRVDRLRRRGRGGRSGPRRR